MKFCASKDHKTCNGTWQDGQIVIAETTEKILRVLPPVFVGDRLVWHGSFGVDNVTFLPGGFSSGYRGSFYYCPKDTVESAIAIILGPTGVVRIFSKTADGKTITCNS